MDADYAGIFELLWDWNTSVNSCIMVAPPFLYTSAGIAPFGLFCGQLVKILIVLHLTLSITLTITLTFTLNLILTLTHCNFYTHSHPDPDPQHHPHPCP